MKKKILSICLVAVIAVMAIAGASLAYFTDNEEAVNTFTFGNVDIELTETKWPTNDRFDVVPGVAYEKNPVVKNIGKNEAWIKVDVTLSDATAFIAAATKYNITDLSTIFTIADDFDTEWVLAEVKQPTAENDTLTYSYYYRKLLEKEADTGALFTAVTIPKQFNNADMNAIGDNFTITVTAHAMQDANFANVQDAFAEYVVEAK